MGLRAPLPAYISSIGRHERHIIRAHADRIMEPYNLCVETSVDLTAALRDKGFSARMLCCTGLKTLAPDADSRWHDLAPQSRWVHCVVKIGEEIIDLTRRQFFPLSAFPFIQSMSAFDAEWDSVSLSEPGPRMQPKLLAVVD